MNDMKWIPVTERLPEVSGKYLVTVVSNEVSVKYDVFWFDGEHDIYDPERKVDDNDMRWSYHGMKKGEKCWCSWDEDSEFYKLGPDLITIVAWMQVEPYNPNN